MSLWEGTALTGQAAVTFVMPAAKGADPRTLQFRPATPVLRISSVVDVAVESWIHPPFLAQKRLLDNRRSTYY